MMSDATPIVYVVDDDISVRQVLEGLIHMTGWRAAVFASAEEFLSHPRTSCLSCLVLDLMLPGLGGLALQQQVAEDGTKMPIIFISGDADVPATVRAMKAGAVEFLTKPFSGNEILEAIRSALDQSFAIQGATSEMMQLLERYASLSAREREVMALVVSGLMNKQVGGKLGISEITVKAHRGRVMQKMKAGSLAQLVNIAAKLEIPHRESFQLKSSPTVNPKKNSGKMQNYPIQGQWRNSGEIHPF